VYAFRTSSTHYKDPAVSVRKKLFVRKSQDCGNMTSTKVLKRENGSDAPMAALISLISGCDTF
jgi:hypothetical protein